jgi:membrane protease YdiL (CAAX protease family)
MIKGIFARRSLTFRFALLGTLLLTGFFASSVVSVLLAAALSPASVAYMQLVQLLASALVFLLPALATAWLCSEQPAAFLRLTRPLDLRRLAWTVAATLLISPTVSLVAHFNARMQLPQFLAPLERMMHEMETAAAALVAQMLHQPTPWSLAVNLVVMAVAAALCEEFLFRGVILNLLRRAIRNPHLAIWIVAAIFSAVHLQFYGFVPRMLLGAFLGYLLYWTESIWLPVAAHFLNNAVAVVGLSSESLKDNAFFTDDMNTSDLQWFTLVALVTLIAFTGCMRAIRNASPDPSKGGRVKTK